ncbi:MAG: hypothetical protein AAGI38_17505 [Bacteroidota bacterium]
MNTIVVKDRTIGGEDLNEIELRFETESVTVKDLITSRVIKEVERYNQGDPSVFSGLVVPEKVEKLLKKTEKPEKRIVDAEQQVYVALDGFTKNQFFVIINDKQAESLDEEIQLSSIKEIEFIKLTPLVGG